MHRQSGEAPTPVAPAFGGVSAGTVLGPVEYTVSRAANERYWSSAGVDHPALRDGALYPPMAANFTILLLQTVAPAAAIQAAQRLVCHRRGDADTTLTVRGRVTERFEKRGREYAVVEAEITLPDGGPLWTSTATFVAPQGG